MTRRSRRKKQEFREIEYRPTSVRKLLTEMKNISEHIVDLAYSSLIFDIREMREEVEELELKMDEYLYQIRMMAMLAARSKEDAEQLSGILQVASAAEGISNAAGDIAAITETKSDQRLLLPFVLKEADEKIERVKILPGSSMVGKRIGDLRVEEVTGVRVIAIRRRSGWMYRVKGRTRIYEGDVFIVRGVKGGIDELRLYASGKMEWNSYTRGDRE